MIRRIRFLSRVMHGQFQNVPRFSSSSGEHVITVTTDDVIAKALQTRRIRLHLPLSTSHATLYRRLHNMHPALSYHPHILLVIPPGSIQRPISTSDNTPIEKNMKYKLLTSVLPTPESTPSYTMVSFYRFFNMANPDAVAQSLQALWAPYHVYGRVYLATEGVNGQMAIPTTLLQQFTSACQSVPLLRDIYFNIDSTLSSEEFYSSAPFHSLHIRVRPQILADDLPAPLDWSKAGKQYNTLEWQEALLDPNAIILDCRNVYESDIGTFDKAIPLNTIKFRETWKQLHHILENKPKDKPILTFCTGGIRCVKVNAYLSQKMGFPNVGSIKGGIISYAKDIEKLSTESNATPIESKFRGVNYVFDNRMGERITEDVLATCETCGSPHDIYINCANTNCSVRFLQCPKCTAKYSRCCSMACKAEMEHKTGKRSTPTTNTTSTKKDVTNTMGDLTASSATSAAITTYCETHSQAEPELLHQLRLASMAKFEAAPRMISGHLQGRLLSQLSHMKSPSRILELGTFTGYASQCLAEGLRRDGILVTVESDAAVASFAETYINQSIYRDKINIQVGKAADVLSTFDAPFELVFIDADKKNYIKYIQQLLQYNLLEDGAVIIIDNTLWKGLVLEQVPQLASSAPTASDFGSEKRMKKLAEVIHNTNEYCLHHPNFTSVMLPFRDGLTILRYHK